jgi:hypothetical protein
VYFLLFKGIFTKYKATPAAHGTTLTWVFPHPRVIELRLSMVT